MDPQLIDFFRRHIPIWRQERDEVKAEMQILRRRLEALELRHDQLVVRLQGALSIAGDPEGPEFFGQFPR